MSGRINLDNMSDDFKSYIQGLDHQVKVNNNNINNNTKKLNKIYYIVSDFEEYVVDGDWAIAINKTIEIANQNKGRILLDGIYDIKSTIFVPSETTIEGYGFSWSGACGIRCVIGGITAIEIQGVGITLENFSVTCTKRFDDYTHGIVLDSSAGWHSFNNYKNIRIVNFNGHGIKFDSIHDSYVENISVEFCGNKDYYAFEVTSHNDTSNHTIFTRIQAEQCYYKIINIDGNVMNCTFENIHSERAIIEEENDIYNYQLSGYRNTFTNSRIESEKIPRIRTGGETNYYSTMIGNGHIFDDCGGRVFYTYINCSIDKFTILNIGKPRLQDCKINELTISGEGGTFDNCSIYKLNANYSGGDKTFTNCLIQDITNDSMFLNSWYYDCRFKLGELSEIVLCSSGHYYNCEFEGNSIINYSTNVKIYSCLFKNNFTLSGNNASCEMICSTVEGDCSRVGNNYFVNILNNFKGTSMYVDSERDKILLLWSQSQENSVATDISTLKNDFNILLTNLRNAGVLK